MLRICFLSSLGIFIDRVSRNPGWPPTWNGRMTLYFPILCLLFSSAAVRVVKRRTEFSGLGLKHARQAPDQVSCVLNSSFYNVPFSEISIHPFSMYVCVSTLVRESVDTWALCESQGTTRLSYQMGSRHWAQAGPFRSLPLPSQPSYLSQGCSFSRVENSHYLVEKEA